MLRLESPVCLEAVACLTQRVLVEGTAIARGDERFCLVRPVFSAF
jgi:hypothetical protein